MDTSTRQTGSAAPSTSDEVFRCLADTTRHRLLQLLLSEELNVGQLVTILSQPQSTVSRHLKVLRDSGLVRDRRIGTTVFYQAVTDPRASDDVRGVILEWLRSQPLPATLEARLRRALRHRSDGDLSFFERMGQRWDDLRTTAFGEGFAWEAFISLLPADWVVADVGCGTGYLLPHLAAHFRQVVAVEPAAAMLECARRRVSEMGLTNVQLHSGNLSELPLGDAGCDLVIACLVLHHVPKPPEALAEMHRVLRPGGRLIVIEQHSHENQAFYDTMQDFWWGFDPEELAKTAMAGGFAKVRRTELISPTTAPREMDAPGLFALTAERK